MNASPLPRSNPLTAWVFLLAGAVLFLSYGYAEVAGSDLWWHIAAGRELLQTGTLWMVDDWSYSFAGSAWLNHEWLSDLVFYGWASLWGVEALVYWKWLVLVSSFLLLQQALSRQGGPLAGFIWAAIAIAIAAPFLDIRPHIYSLLNFSLLLFLLLGRQTSVWLLAILFAVWVNLHGGFFFGLMALGILLFPWRDFSVGGLQSAVVIGVICVLAAMLNPYGFNAFLYPLKYAFVESSPYRNLWEWQPPFRPGGMQSPLFMVFMWVPIVAFAYFLPTVKKRVDVPFEGFVLTALTLAMALTSRRFIPLYAISLAVLMAPMTGLLLRRLEGRRLSLALAALALLYAVDRQAPMPLKSAPAYHYLTAEHDYPVDMLNFAQANGLSGKVFAYYNWGGYIHWRTDGKLKVYIDGRADTLYDAATYNSYVQVLASQPGWIEQLEATGPDYILWPHFTGYGQEKLQQLLHTGRWRLVHRDAVSWLLVRNTIERPDTVVATPDTAWRHMGKAQLSAWAGNIAPAIEAAEEVRRTMPWHRGACNLLTALYRQQGKIDEADDVLRSCRAYFPSPKLR